MRILLLFQFYLSGFLHFEGPDPWVHDCPFERKKHMNNEPSQHALFNSKIAYPKLRVVLKFFICCLLSQWHGGPQAPEGQPDPIQWHSEEGRQRWQPGGLRRRRRWPVQWRWLFHRPVQWQEGEGHCWGQRELRGAVSCQCHELLRVTSPWSLSPTPCWHPPPNFVTLPSSGAQTVPTSLWPSWHHMATTSKTTATKATRSSAWERARKREDVQESVWEREEAIYTRRMYRNWQTRPGLLG